MYGISLTFKEYSELAVDIFHFFCMVSYVL
jgi:hypothetical protein